MVPAMMNTLAHRQPRLPPPWLGRRVKRIAITAVAVALGAGAALSAMRALPAGARLTSAEEQGVRAILADARATRAAAIAYFSAQDGAAGHTDDIDEVVSG